MNIFQLICTSVLFEQLLVLADIFHVFCPEVPPIAEIKGSRVFLTYRNNVIISTEFRDIETSQGYILKETLQFLPNASNLEDGLAWMFLECDKMFIFDPINVEFHESCGTNPRICDEIAELAEFLRHLISAGSITQVKEVNTHAFGVSGTRKHITMLYDSYENGCLYGGIDVGTCCIVHSDCYDDGCTENDRRNCDKDLEDCLDDLDVRLGEQRDIMDAVDRNGPSVFLGNGCSNELESNTLNTNYQFLALDEAVDWYTAERNCNNMGGNLASIHSSTENDALVLKCESIDGVGTECWIGLKANAPFRTGDEDEFSWSDGTIMNYEHWDTEQPNDEGDRRDACGQLRTDRGDGWFDGDCNQRRIPICAVPSGSDFSVTFSDLSPSDPPTSITPPTPSSQTGSPAPSVGTVDLMYELCADDYCMGGAGRDCYDVCESHGRSCGTFVDTRDSADIFESFGTCQTDQEISKYENCAHPVYVSGEGSDFAGYCAGYEDVRDQDCGCDHRDTQRLCHCPEISRWSCEDLGLESAREGSSDVCAASEINNRCSGEVSFMEAESFCRDEGMRLCTRTELTNDEADDLPCNYGWERVWSSSSCAPGSYFTLSGEASYGSQQPLECTSYTTSRDVFALCCADGSYEESPSSPTPDTSRASSADTVDIPPHIVIFLVDDLGWHDVGFNGAEFSTPFIDDLADSGIQLTNFYVQPLCAPSRAALMTGRLPIELGVQNYVFYPLAPTFVDYREMLPERLGDLRYDTFMVGKWHLGYQDKSSLPCERFDSFFGMFQNKFEYFTHDLSPGNVNPDCDGRPYDPDYGSIRHPYEIFGYDLFDERCDNVGWDYHGEYATDLFANKAIDMINDHGRRNDPDPIFLYVSYTAVHDPWQVPYEYYNHRDCEESGRQSEERQILCGMMKSLDDSVSRIADALDANDYIENTLIIFMSDNGATPIDTNYAYGTVKPAGSNYPLRNGKGAVWEGGTRVPAFVWGNPVREDTWRNGRISSSRSSRREKDDEMFHISDWFLTILEAAGCSSCEREYKTDDVNGVRLTVSMSQWQHLKNGDSSPRETVLYNIAWPTDVIRGAIRSRDYKLVLNQGLGNFDGWFDASSSRRDEINCSDEHEDTDALPCSQVLESEYFFRIIDDPEERHPLDVDRLSDREKRKYDELKFEIELFASFAVPALIGDDSQREYDAQGLPRIWDCHWRPWTDNKRLLAPPTCREGDPDFTCSDLLHMPDSIDSWRNFAGFPGTKESKIDWKIHQADGPYEDRTISVGETVVFEFFDDTHDITQFLDRGHYEDCDFSNGTKLADTSPYTFVGISQMKDEWIYLGCSRGTHCTDEGGQQKVQINVVK